MACKRSAVRSRVAPPNQQKARPCDGLFVYGRKSLLDGLALGTASSALAGKVPGYSILRLEHLAPAVAVSVLGGDAPAAASLPRQHFPRG